MTEYEIADHRTFVYRDAHDPSILLFVHGNDVYSVNAVGVVIAEKETNKTYKVLIPWHRAVQLKWWVQDTIVREGLK